MSFSFYDSVLANRFDVLLVDMSGSLGKAGGFIAAVSLLIIDTFVKLPLTHTMQQTRTFSLLSFTRSQRHLHVFAHAGG